MSILQIQYKICCRKAIKNHVKIFERIIDGVIFQMYTCSSHVEEYSEDCKETKKDEKIKTLNVSPKDSKYICEKPISNSINGSTCQTCKKPLEMQS